MLLNLFLCYFLLGFTLCGWEYIEGDYTPCYEYREVIDVTNVGATPLSEVHVSVATDSLPLYSSVCEDLRFKINTDPDFTVANDIPFWFESKCPSTATMIWLNMTNFQIPVGNSASIYMYSGCETATMDLSLTWSGEFISPMKDTCPFDWFDYNAANDHYILDDGNVFGSTNESTTEGHDHLVKFKLAADTNPAIEQTKNDIPQIYRTGRYHEHYNAPDHYFGAGATPLPKFRPVRLCQSTTLDWPINMIGMFDGEVPSSYFTATNEFDGYTFIPETSPIFTSPGGTFFPSDGEHTHTFVCDQMDKTWRIYAVTVNRTEDTFYYVNDGGTGSGWCASHNTSIMEHEHCIDAVSESGDNYPPYYTLNFGYSASQNTNFDHSQIIMASEQPPLGWKRSNINGRIPVGGSNGITGGSWSHDHLLLNSGITNIDDPPSMSCPRDMPGITIAKSFHNHANGFDAAYDNRLLPYNHPLKRFSTSFFQRNGDNYTHVYGPVKLLRRCETGYCGEDCEIPICYSVPANDSDNVCSGNGTCSSPNNCSCGDYVGYECQNWKCGATYLNNDTNVCSGNGTCNSPNQCVCPDYVGSECQNWLCGAFLDNQTGSVCNGHGACVYPGNCSCIDPHFGDECESIRGTICYSLSDPAACGGGNGTCSSDNNCTCLNDHLGETCGTWKCGMYFQNDTINVCSTRGQCTAPDQCLCPGYENLCANWRCGVFLDTEIDDVCSGHGLCTLPEECSCLTNYTYLDDCSLWKCNDVFSNDSGVCSGNGNCTAYNTCTCDSTHEGELCAEIKAADTVFDTSEETIADTVVEAEETTADTQGSVVEETLGVGETQVGGVDETEPSGAALSGPLLGGIIGGGIALILVVVVCVVMTVAIIVVVVVGKRKRKIQDEDDDSDIELDELEKKMSLKKIETSPKDEKKKDKKKDKKKAEKKGKKKDEKKDEKRGKKKDAKKDEKKQDKKKKEDTSESDEETESSDESEKKKKKKDDSSSDEEEKKKAKKKKEDKKKDDSESDDSSDEEEKKEKKKEKKVKKKEKKKEKKEEKKEKKKEKKKKKEEEESSDDDDSDSDDQISDEDSDEEEI